MNTIMSNDQIINDSITTTTTTTTPEIFNNNKTEIITKSQNDNEMNQQSIDPLNQTTTTTTATKTSKINHKRARSKDNNSNFDPTTLDNSSIDHNNCNLNSINNYSSSQNSDDLMAMMIRMRENQYGNKQHQIEMNIDGENTIINITNIKILKYFY
jgi:hypothetical protein